MVIFKDRQSAGKLLAERLKDVKANLVLGIPRGGVMVAYEISKYLNLPLDVIITRKIGAPNQPELALGAVDPDGEVSWEENLLKDLKLKIDGLKEEVEKQKEEIRRRDKIYRGNRKVLDVKGKVVILVDDGIATGATVLSAIRYIKRHIVSGSQTRSYEAKLILAVPVASEEAMAKISREVDEVVVLHIPPLLGAVGQFYQQFEEVSDEKVIELLQS